MDNNEPIERVTRFKYLGLYIDQQLTWDHHIDYIHDKSSKKLREICKTRNCMERNTALQLYKS